VPHFEKMLYDNALLAIAYLEAWQITGKQLYADIAADVLDYVLRGMAFPEGGFFSAEDADSEGEEGRFYLWTPKEVTEVLGEDDGQIFCAIYDITPQGNFEGRSIPNLINSKTGSNSQDFILRCKKRLFEHRERRVHPFKDDKVLASWNGLMVAAMSIAGRVLCDARYTEAAEKAVRFISGKLIGSGGRLQSSYRDGRAGHPAFADGYGFLIWGYIELYETCFKPEYLQKALELNSGLLRLFWDDRNSGLFVYGSDSEELITHQKESYDGAMPSGNSVAALNMLRLARLTGRQELEEKAVQIFKAFGKSLSDAPLAHAFLLSALLYAQSSAQEVILAGTGNGEMLGVLNGSFRPFTQTIVNSGDGGGLSEIMPHIASYKPVEGMSTAYVCEDRQCRPPVTSAEQLGRILDGRA
ncbi:MAG: thioredoxin domain-containing protein, partial [Bacillota bacterium]|nr:thioredoxin domain-containing protein [Bacillota bacterium]